MIIDPKLFYLLIVVLLASCARDAATRSNNGQCKNGSEQGFCTGTITSIRDIRENDDADMIGQNAGNLLLGNVDDNGRNEAGSFATGLLIRSIYHYTKQAIRGNKERIYVHLDKGGSVSVVQSANRHDLFFLGERVRVVRNKKVEH